MRYFWALLIASMLLSGCGQTVAEKKAFDYERNEKMMGTVITLKANGSEAQRAVDESFNALFQLVDAVKNDVHALNENAGNGTFINVSPQVFKMLKLSQEYAELTDGAFDVTVGAAVDLWREARKTQTLPSTEEIERVKNLTGYKYLQLNDATQSARLNKAGVKINLGGAGKGCGVDVARNIFIAHGTTDGIIDLGSSSMCIFGKKLIGLKNPRGTQEPIQTLECENEVLSTSGDYEQFFTVNGKKYCHIINPKTGTPIDNGIASVTVRMKADVTDCGTLSDILSTSVFILGEEQSKEFIRKIPAAAGYTIIRAPSNP